MLKLSIRLVDPQVCIHFEFYTSRLQCHGNKNRKLILLLVCCSGSCSTAICISVFLESNCKCYRMSDTKSNQKPHGKSQFMSNQETNSEKTSFSPSIFISANLKNCCPNPNTYFHLSVPVLVANFYLLVIFLIFEQEN